MLFCLTFHLLFLFGNILLQKHWIYALTIDNDNIIENVMLKFIPTKSNINAKKHLKCTKKTDV